MSLHSATRGNTPNAGVPRSEYDAQRKLHEAGRSQRPKVSAELCRTEGERRLCAAHVVAHRVGGVERFPFEFQSPLLTQREFLGYARIDIKHALADDAIANSGFARPLWTVGRQRRCRIFEDIGAAHPVHNNVFGIGCHRSWTVRLGIAFDVPVGGPGEAVVNGDGEAAGPAEYAGYVPSANQLVDDRVRVPRQHLASPEGQTVDQVRVDLVEGVEVGEPAQRQRIPRIDDNPSAVQVVARSAGSFIRADSFRGRGFVERFRKRVVELPLQVGSPAGVVGYLQRVVVGSADVAPRVQRTELVMVERIRAELAVGKRGRGIVY